MSVITELDASFRNRQASYKMVTVLAMLENCSANGVARLDDVTRYFKNFYESRQRFGKKPEKDKIEMSRVATLTDARVKELILTNPVQALNKFITYRGDRQELSFTDKVVAELTESTRQEIRNLAYKHLYWYYKDFDPHQITLPELSSLAPGVAVTATDIALLSGQNQVKGIHPIFKENFKAVVILCTIGGELYPNQWLTEDRTILKYYLEGRTDKETGKKTYNLDLPSNKAIIESREEGYPLYVFVRDKKGELFHFAGEFMLDRVEQEAGGADYYFILRKVTKMGIPDEQTNPRLMNSDKERLKYNEIVEHIYRYISNKGYLYETGLIKNFFLCLKTKPFVILAGISGTGKSKLVEVFAEAVGATTENGRFVLIPVRPDWNDSSDLLGYKDINGKFLPGPLTRVIQRANSQLDKPFFVCLDEMNLSRVEYYFSDILSLMETKKKTDAGCFSEKIFHDDYFHTDEDKQRYGQLRIPPNLYVIGTVNMDETTFPFSKKVLDRANTIEFSTVHLKSFPGKDMQELSPLPVNNNVFQAQYLNLKDCLDSFEYLESVVDKIDQINAVLSKANLHVGYRVRDEICFYMAYNKAGGLLEEDEAFDYQLMQKILPRIQGSSNLIFNVLVELFKIASGQDYSNHEAGVGELALKYVQDNNNIKPYPRSAAKIATMLWRFDDGFTSFWL
ncbi:McrB family protein [Thermincola potens]|uniref:ATPase associated with various cellular activities AAA_5 n=1 Tax=Thermincola potens (strain JR) TaxID=635013 RepID=D5XB00_THEPJ|nr:AAA family ATPase [Thermincola potens]ADG81320.1 ATPase associated with various cellular activities AAA_5 [Thermincola potens JR]